MRQRLMLEQGVEAIHGIIAVDQVEALASPDIPANDRRIELVLQNSGTTTVAYAGSPVDTANGPILEACWIAANDGTSREHRMQHYTGPLWLRAISGPAGNVRFVEYVRRDA